MQEKREKILKEALKIVPFDGWTASSLEQASKNAGFADKYAQIAFPEGASQAVELLLRKLDEQMLEKLKEYEISKLKVRERIPLAIKTRLELAAPYKQAIRKTLSLYTSGSNGLNAVPSLWKTVDQIWYAAGDTSSDFNYYTKRMTLAAVYSSTLLYWLSDKSKDHADTWDFLKRRIENVMQFNNLKGKVKKLLGA